MVEFAIHIIGHFHSTDILVSHRSMELLIMAKYHANIWKNIYSKHHIRYAQWFFCCYCEIFIAYRTICPGFSWILSKYLWNMRSPWTGNDFSYFSSLSLFIETIPPVTRLHGLLGFAFCSIFLWNKMKIYIKTLFLNYLIWLKKKSLWILLLQFLLLFLAEFSFN